MTASTQILNLISGGRKDSCLLANSYPTLCDPMDQQPPLFIGFFRQEYWSVFGVVAISLSRGSSQSRNRTCVS